MGEDDEYEEWVLDRLADGSLRRATGPMPVPAGWLGDDPAYDAARAVELLGVRARAAMRLAATGKGRLEHAAAKEELQAANELDTFLSWVAAPCPGFTSAP